MKTQHYKPLCTGQEFPASHVLGQNTSGVGGTSRVGKTGCMICGAQCEAQPQGSLWEHEWEFHTGDSRAVSCQAPLRLAGCAPGARSAVTWDTQGGASWFWSPSGEPFSSLLAFLGSGFCLRLDLRFQFVLFGDLNSCNHSKGRTLYFYFV